jgi:Na+-transporting NADH:ubiquinone oxidoreductase subunit NqrE
LSGAVLKRIEATQSTTHFSAALPVVLSAGIGVLAILFTVAELSLAWKVGLAVVVLLAMGGAVSFLLRSIHYKQAALWELYTFVSMQKPRKAVDEMDYAELMVLEGVIAKIQQTENFHKQRYDDFVSEAINMIELKYPRD